MITAAAKRELLRFMSQRGLSERRPLAVVATSASALSYQSAPDRNNELRAEIACLTQLYQR